MFKDSIHIDDIPAVFVLSCDCPQPHPLYQSPLKINNIIELLQYYTTVLCGWQSDRDGRLTRGWLGDTGRAPGPGCSDQKPIAKPQWWETSFPTI